MCARAVTDRSIAHDMQLDGHASSATISAMINDIRLDEHYTSFYATYQERNKLPPPVSTTTIYDEIPRFQIPLHQDLPTANTWTAAAAAAAAAAAVAAVNQANAKGTVQSSAASTALEEPPVEDVVEAAVARGILIYAREQVGCRALQKAVDEQGPELVALLIEKLQGDMKNLMVDPFGNYLAQKIFEVANRMDLLVVADEVSSGDVTGVVCDAHGTRAMQKLLQRLAKEGAANSLVPALARGVPRIVRDSHGSHVAQLCLRLLGEHDCEFIYEYVLQNPVGVACSRHGCCVVQRCLDAAPPTKLTKLLEAIVEHALELCNDPYGNYVLQHALRRGGSDTVAGVSESLSGQVANFARGKFSSNVLERLLQIDSNASKGIILELADSGDMLSLLLDPFANYVVQSALASSRGKIHHRLATVVGPHLRKLGSAHAVRIAGKSPDLAQYLPEAAAQASNGKRTPRKHSHRSS